MPALLRLLPDPRERVWGGTRLGPPRRHPIGENWLAGPATVVADGPDAGRTLAEIALRDGIAFVGSAAHARTGARFPLLAKLLDPAEWLSVQVHPDDELAVSLEGPGAVGKTEAWHIVEADPGASLLLGIRDGVSAATVRRAIRDAGAVAAPAVGGQVSPTESLVAPLLARHAPAPGTSYLVPAGVLHAVGPGLLAYELQQASDLTYRCEDWGRPSTPERPLHTEQALACVRPDLGPVVVAPPDATVPAGPGAEDPQRERRITCDHFAFDLVRLPAACTLRLKTAGRSVHVVTALDPVVVRSDDEAVSLGALEALVVAASAFDYVLEAPARSTRGPARVLVGYVA